MRPLTRIGAFAALLLLLGAGAALAGGSIDPAVEEGGGHDTEGDAMQIADSHFETASGHGEATHGAEGRAQPGLAVAQGGFALELERTTLSGGTREKLSFRIAGPDGDTVRDFDVEHERRMHLIVVRRDYTGFQHLHPAQQADGSWSAETAALEPGVHRVFADFSSGGRSLTLGADLFVPGDFAPRPWPDPAERADAGDGYTVAIETGDLHAGRTSPVRFTVSRNGERVEGVQPYLGADGHLVALREGDQAFLHTHPEGAAGGEGPITFEVAFPTAGRYRLYLQFRHADEVRTASFAVEAEGEDSHGGAP